MKISVMGAGGVGSFYGAMLVQAGHDVTFIGRAGQVAALREFSCPTGIYMAERIFLMLQANFSIANGLVSTCIPGRSCPSPITAFSA